MAPNPAAGLDGRYSRVGRAAFALARRICGCDEVAADVVAEAFAGSAGVPAGAVGDGLLLRRVRELACDRTRLPVASVPLGEPPAALLALPRAHWHVLALVALRGAGVREAASRLQLSEEAILMHLHDAVRMTRELLSGTWQPDDHPDSAALALLR